MQADFIFLLIFLLISLVSLFFSFVKSFAANSHLDLKQPIESFRFLSVSIIFVNCETLLFFPVATNWHQWNNKS